jgi:zinc/manganese transport system substrate-binding protein
MTFLRLILFMVLALPVTVPVFALDVVASSSSTAALVREIAGDHVKLTILAPPDRDIHYLQARPSMIHALRGADLVVALGADLEVGWLPLAISQAANPKILPGKAGYFEAAVQVSLLDVGGPADRALGDIHPTGNPHINMDPVRMAEVSTALAERMALLDSKHAEEYRARAVNFAKQVDEKVAEWRVRLSNPKGVVSFHKDVTYLLDRFEIPHLGILEPVPGVPPTASHIQSLIREQQGKSGIILYTTYQPEQAPVSVAEALGWKHIPLPLEPPLDADGKGYLMHMQRWIDALAGNS